MNKSPVIRRLLLILHAWVTLIYTSLAQVDTNYYYQNLIDLSKIQISSEKKTNQNLSTTSATMRVITSKQIEEKAHFTLEDALSELPGFQFRDMMGLNSYSFLRGLPRQNNSILVLIDGIQINELNSGGFYGGGQYNLANVERIEVLYGPASVIYGSNAISGIINLITKSPDKPQEVMVNNALGNFNTYSTDFSYSHKGDKIGLQLSGMIKNTEKADLSDENNDNNWDENLEIFESDYAFDAKVYHKKLVAGVNYQFRQSSANTYQPSVNTVHKGYGSLWNLQLINTYLKHSTTIDEKANLQTTLYNRNATVLGNSVIEVTDTGQIGYFRPNNLFGFESVLELNPLRNFNLVIGLFGDYENLANGFSKSYSTEYFLKPQKPSWPSMTNNALAGSFIQVHYGFLKYWKFVPGLRYEYSTSYKQVITPRASFLFNKEKFSSKLIYARAFRAPKPWDFTSGIGNQDLEPEYFNSFELSNTWFISNSIKTDFSFYSNNLYNGLIQQNTDDNTNFYWDNTGNTLTRGLETSFSYNTQRLISNISYSYCYSVDDLNEQIAEIAPHIGMLGVKYHFASKYSIALNTFYFGKRKNPKLVKATNSLYIDDALVTNVYFSMHQNKNTSINLVVKNLTNTKYYHTSNQIPDRYRQAQLSFYLKLTYKFKKQ